jgi:hypothetical protein
MVLAPARCGHGFGADTLEQQSLGNGGGGHPWSQNPNDGFDEQWIHWRNEEEIHGDNYVSHWEKFKF